MSTRQVWMITGAGRGMGVDIAKAALAAGHQVVATGRTGTVESALGASDDLLIVQLDLTKPGDAEEATAAAIDRFELIAELRRDPLRIVVTGPDLMGRNRS